MNKTPKINSMEQALKLCSLALNPSSPSPTATMVAVTDGYMVSYGGQFCIRVPVSQDIGAAFNPKALATFFRKERTLPAYTIKFPKLTVSEGKERLTIHCLPAEDVVTIDNIETPTPCTVNLKNVKGAATLCATEGPIYSQGVTFRDGSVMATNNKVFFCGESGLDDETFIIHKDAALALSQFKSDVVSLSKNNHTVKFIFKSGASLCAHILVEQIPDVGFLFDGERIDFSVSEDVWAVDCEDLEIRDGSAFYQTDNSIGELEGDVIGNVTFKIPKRYFDLLKGGELSFGENKLQSNGDDWVMVSIVLSK